jgi:hypothetical protein
MCFYVGNDIYYLRKLEDDLCGLTRTRYVSRVNSDWFFKLMSGKLLGRVFDSAPSLIFNLYATIWKVRIFERTPAIRNSGKKSATDQKRWQISKNDLYRFGS